jgi:hypothetical protein
MLKLIASATLCILALFAAVDQARAQVGISVVVENGTAAKARGVFQTTGFGDTSSNCTASSGSGFSKCEESRTYKSAPKNVKNMLCISSKVTVKYEQQCEALMKSPGATCKRNDIFTTLCGPGYGTNVVPRCMYRTGANGFSSWTWKVTLIDGEPKSVRVGCWNSGYPELKP